MINFPYPDMQQLNLDWIIGRLKAIMRFIPGGGAVGQILRRTSTGAEWSDEQSATAPVSSVNGKTGAVVLDATDVGALPDTYTAPVSSVNGQTGAVSLDAADVGALPDTYAPPAVNLVYYGVCSTADSVAAKTVTISGITQLEIGMTINVKFTSKNTATNPTLDVNGLGPVPMYQYGTTAMGGTESTTGWYAGAIVQLTYDGNGWYRDQAYNTNTTYTTTNVYCATSASTAAKVGSGTYFALPSGANAHDQIFDICFRYSNTKAGALTLNITSSGAKPIWINGEPSSATNYTLPAGHYLCRYNLADDRYEFWTGSRVSMNIHGYADGAPQRVIYSLPPSGSVTIDFAIRDYGIIMIASATKLCLYMVNCANTGVVNYSAIVGDSAFTITTGTQTLTIANSLSTTQKVAFINYV